MKWFFDFEFFPVLREVGQEPLIQEVRKRNALRLQIMKDRGELVYREPAQSIAQPQQGRS